MASEALRIDIFCRVVDNFGDIGVSWRLARQWAREQGAQVRLFVDQLSPAVVLVPEVDAAKEAQVIDGVQWRRWNDDLSARCDADLVIEAFACELPETYVESMAARKKSPVWVNLEYLSAEAWIEEHHGLPSPHPRWALTKYFYFPGFTANSGGLIRERDRDAPVVESPFADPVRTLVFRYPVAPAEALLAATRASAGRRIQWVFPEHQAGKVLDGQGFPGKNGLEAAPDLECVDFVPQREFDAFLASFDLLFIRGEDSLVRAIWSGKPFVWNLYPQPDAAHRAKLDAFVDRYVVGLEAEAASAYRDFTLAWNGFGESGVADSWRQFLAVLPELVGHAARWSNRQRTFPDLATKLLSFYEKIVKMSSFAAPHQPNAALVAPDDAKAGISAPQSVSHSNDLL